MITEVHGRCSTDNFEGTINLNHMLMFVQTTVYWTHVEIQDEAIYDTRSDSLKDKQKHKKEKVFRYFKSMLC